MTPTPYARVALPTPFQARILSKSHDLFAKRGVLALAKSRLGRDEFKEWIGHALSLQMAIYGLDHYYEGNAALRPSDEGPLWAGVERELRRERLVRDEFLWKDFADLRRYAEVETRIHQFDPIDSREFVGIAHLKCADVRMARGLIWSYDGPPASAALRYWELYDQCWELIEDVLDIEEDGADWNFNFWLYSFMAGEDPVTGISASCDALWRKLADLEEAFSRLPVTLRAAEFGGFRATAFAAELARRCQTKVLNAISRGSVVPFCDQPFRAARAA